MEINRVGLRNRSAKVSDGKVDCQDYCPTCDYGPLDGATKVEIAEEDDHDNSPPKAQPGDITLCARCGELLNFIKEGEKLKLEKANDQVWESLKEDQQFYQLLLKLQDGIRRRYRNGNQT